MLENVVKYGHKKWTSYLIIIIIYNKMLHSNFRTQNSGIADAISTLYGVSSDRGIWKKNIAGRIDREVPICIESAVSY